jgi:hypothetical protein
MDTMETFRSVIPAGKRPWFGRRGSRGAGLGKDAAQIQADDMAIAQNDYLARVSAVHRRAAEESKMAQLQRDEPGRETC